MVYLSRKVLIVFFEIKAFRKENINVQHTYSCRKYISYANQTPQVKIVSV